MSKCLKLGGVANENNKSEQKREKISSRRFARLSHRVLLDPTGIGLGKTSANLACQTPQPTSHRVRQFGDTASRRIRSAVRPVLPANRRRRHSTRFVNDTKMCWSGLRVCRLENREVPNIW
jgi:hypothetical protein